MSLPAFSAYRASRLIAKNAAANDQILIEVESTARELDRFVRPGQFLRLRVNDALGVAHEGIFAMATAPFERALRFLVRTQNAAGGEAADRIAEMSVGQELELTEPTGAGFALEGAKHRDLHFVATGTAIAPVRSAIEWVLSRRSDYGALSIDHGLRSPLHLAFASDFERWRSLGMRVSLHYSAPESDGELRGARVQDQVLEHVRDIRRATFVAVGQAAMVAELRDRVREAGGDPEHVLHNY